MKETILLKTGWSIRQLAPTGRLDPLSAAGDGEWLEAPEMPAQVHDILYAHRRIPEEYRVGWCEGALWTDEWDWLYRCTFPSREGAAASLVFHGLDTFADLYLNGELLGSHDDFYLTAEFDVTGKLESENQLLIHFHNVRDLLASLTLPPQWAGAVTKYKLLRKPVHDFFPENQGGSNYQGACPWFSPIGIYRDVALVYPDTAQLLESDLRAVLQEDCGVVQLTASGTGVAEGLTLRLLVREAGGRCFETTIPCETIPKGFVAEGRVCIECPQLWWPRGMGAQNLYEVEVLLLHWEQVLDRLQKQLGFRSVENPSSMEFIINKKPLRLWGGSMDPLQGYTHCWQPQRAARLFTMVENANMNMLRIWGEGHPCPDSFYEEADRRGILIWQEFFMGHGSYPDSPAFRARCVKEARELVLRLRHHACLLMWCGGNESIMGAQHDYKEVLTNQLLLEDFPRLLSQLDPGRYYHPSSPYGGEWANDPREGDYHTYNCVWEYPYESYPNFMSECIRTAPPVLHSLEKMVKGPLWPEGYSGKFLHGETFPFPDSWAARSHHSAKGHIKTGPYWEFYDAENPAQLIYRFAAAYGKDLRGELEHVRMGSPEGNVPSSRRSKGYCACKLLDTWPKIYCAVIDFFQEGYIPYYETLRGLRPLLVCFDKKESIRLWLCNDTGDDFVGSIRFGIYHLGTERYLVQKQIPVEMAMGCSGIVYNLAELCFFPKDSLLCAVLEDAEGRRVSESIQTLTQERRLCFPDAVLQVEILGDILQIKSDRFAHCVEILGRQGDNPFGWLFSDNYFDLLPGEVREVRVVDGPGDGVITLKAHYSSTEAQVTYRR